MKSRQEGKVPSVASPRVSGKEAGRGPAGAPTLEGGNRKDAGDTGSCPCPLPIADGGQTDVPSPRQGSPATGPSPQPGGCPGPGQAKWGRGGGGAEMTTLRLGKLKAAGALGGPQARPQTMTTVIRGQIKKEPVTHALPAPATPAAARARGGLRRRRPSRLRLGAQVRGCPPRGARSGRSPLPRKTSTPCASSCRSLRKGGKGFWGRAGRDECRGGARSLLLFLLFSR